MSGSILGPGAMAQLRDDHKKLSRLHPGPPVQTPAKQFSPQRKRVAIIGGIAAPSAVLGTPTTCVCAVLRLNRDSGQLEVTDDRITVTNFSKGLSAVDGTYGKAEFDGVWELYWVDCSASSDLTGLNPTPTPEVGEGEI